MDSTTHPVLCCIGDSVAGQATQFLMERAIAAAHLDWRVITVEVQSDKLDVAFEGMKSMGFAAIRFFSPFVRRAAELLCADGLEHGFVGGVTSAKAETTGWKCWHHAGAAMHKCANRHCDWTQATVWIDGDSQGLRSLLLNCIEEPPMSVYWTNPPEAVPPVIAQRTNVHLLTQASQEDFASLLAQQLSANTGASTLVLFGDLTDIRLQTIASLEVPPNSHLIAAVAGSGVKRRLKTCWHGEQLSVISESDLAIAQEAIDFHCWTGREADLSLLQDAYEEYTDF